MTFALADKNRTFVGTAAILAFAPDTEYKFRFSDQAPWSTTKRFPAIFIRMNASYYELQLTIPL
jgi:hypothetical protein